MDDKFKVFRQLLDLCEARGYDPEGASLERQIHYEGIRGYECGEEQWCLVWNDKIDYEDWGPQSAADETSHPALLFLSGREEWYDEGELSRKTGPAVVTSDGVQQFFIGGKEIKS